MAKTKDTSSASRLVAVILITRSRPGPHLVFHYPAIPQPSHLKNKNATEDESESDQDSDSVLDVRNGKTEYALNGTTMSSTKQEGLSSIPGDVHRDKPSLDTILGFSEETLEKILSPGCWSDRKKFEICVDGLTFVGHPIYAAQDGSWARKHSHADDVSRLDRRSPTPTPLTREEQDSKDPSAPLGITITEPRSPVSPKQGQDFTHLPGSLDSRGGEQSLATSMNSGSSTSAAVVPEPLTMFHVVFVLRRPTLGNAHQEVSVMYQHVAKKLSKALHYCQNQSQYLGIESKKLLALKAKARQDGLTDPNALCGQMLEGSELAWALKEVYERIAASEIADVRLNGMPLSLQIPQLSSPDRLEEGELPHSGLLLLEPKETLLRDLAHPEASPLKFFIREHTPTKSLQKHAMNLNMPINDILSLTRHLIKWRKARLIVPLHQRNTYIVGPDAPLHQLESHYTADYAKKFPVLPSLSQVLKVLSGKPVKYGMLVPSRDHRTPYMEILAYLAQHRFVSQLKTYGWLQAPTTVVVGAQRVGEEVNENRRPLSVTSLLSPQMRPVSDDDTMSVSSERTTIPIAVVESKRLRRNRASSSHSGSAVKVDESEGVEIIADPENLSAEDTQRLQHIRDSVRDPELCDRLHSLLRHFDGEHAFEEIAAVEDLKRSKVESWIEGLQKEGFLVSFRSL